MRRIAALVVVGTAFLALLGGGAAGRSKQLKVAFVTDIISTSPRDNSNPQLQDVGHSYGVLKLKSDPPHWSSDGH